MPTPKGMVKDTNLTEKGVSAGLQTRAWLRGTIYQEALKASPMTQNMNLIEVIEPESTKDAIGVSSKKEIISISTSNKDVNESDESVTIALGLAIDDAAVNGNAQYIGEESTLDYKYVTVYANDFGRPIATFGYGIDKQNLSWLNGDSQIRPKLSTWIGETKDLHKHQAYNEIISENLEAAPVGLTKGINPNIAFVDEVAGTDGFVTYDSTLATFKEAIGDAAAQTTASLNHFTVPRILLLADQASQNKYIKTLDIDGMSLYKVYTSREEIRYLRDAANSASYGAYYLDAAGMEKVRSVVPNAALVVGDIIFIGDDRASTLEIGGVDGSWTTTFGYQQQGRGDSLAASGAATKTLFNVNVLVGAESLIEYERDMVDIREDDDDYGRNKGTLIRECSGCTLPVFDIDTATDTSVQQEGSILILSARESAIGKAL